MKIRIAKKKLKKVISEAYRINKRRVKLTRTYFAFRSEYGYRYRDGSNDFYFIRIREKKKKKPIIVTRRTLRRFIKDLFKADERKHVPETETREEVYHQPPRTRRCRRTHGNVNNSK